MPFDLMGTKGFFTKPSGILWGQDVVMAVQDFFRHQRFGTKLNNTYITIIPKVKNPCRVGDYRPISLTNFVYGVITKILANRLKHLLKDIISPIQDAFIADRSINENVHLAHECNHKIRRIPKKTKALVYPQNG